ncbi:hypothetical protein HPB50_020498 [Hyalomma asiaticum]|uniref:Uncharacterized protein n=1 Tax=Hyalomma asiaticum TaxID=266040 RepID=A0ACB7RMA1_HYAAI|nr:hypothetical protein HPB50_020498 [Hyalomma asiaticum]
MDLLLSQSEQASDQSLFSQKTDTISEAYSTCSPADTLSVGETVQKLSHSSQASQHPIDETTDERLQVIPEREESSPQEGGLEGPRVPESPQTKHADSATSNVQGDFGEKAADTSAAENIPREDAQNAEANDGSILKTKDSGIYSERRNSNVPIDDDASDNSVELPASALSENNHRRRRARLLDDSDDDDMTSDPRVPESKITGNDTEQVDSAVPDSSNLNDNLEVPSAASGNDTAKKPRRIRVLDDSDDDSASEPMPRGVVASTNSDAVRGDESDAGAGQSLSELCRRIGDSSDDEAVDDVSGDASGGDAVDNETSNGPWGSGEDSGATGDVKKKERAGRKSAKKAMEELKQIYSTSQRMARERQMSLPYHEPERLSLKDFLQQRRSAGSESNSTSKKDETTAAVIPSSSTDLLLDDLPAVLNAPDGVDDQKCSEEPEMIEVTPAEKQPAETSSPPSSKEKVEMQQLSARRRRNLEAIAAGIVPRLSKEPVILLSDGNDDLPKGVDHLLKRLVKHTKVDEAKKKKESVKANTIVVPGFIEECPISQKGVSQLSVLKEKLLSKVRQQRNRSREQRYLQQCLDNEELPPDAVHSDDAPKSPLALAEELDEEENDFSDGDTSSGGEEEEQDADNSDDEDVVPKHKKRAKRVNPLSDDEDQDDTEETKKAPMENVEDEDEDSIGELHLEMPAFLDAEDNIDQPEGDEDYTESFLDSSQVPSSQKTAHTPLLQKSGAVRSFQPDEIDLFSPLTGLPRTQSKTNTPQQETASASSSFQESPMGTCVSRPLSLAFSPLAGTAGALTACRSLRRQFSEDCPKPWEGGTPAPVNPSQDMDELVGLCSGSFGARLQDFFEDEAELSGSDVGSDGEDDDDDEEAVLADLIAAENGKEDEDKIREEIGRFHFKQLLDEDKRELKIYQELLLEDGDLHSDGAGRQRQFRWRNSGTDDLDQQPGSEGEEEAHNETEQEADTTWRLQRLERRRWLQEQESSQNPDIHESASFSEQDSLLRAPTVIAKQDLKFSNKPARKKKAMCGSFLKLDSGVLGRIAERIKVAPPTEVEGSVTTKNFVFRAAEEKPQKKRPAADQPSQESKKPKLVKLSEKKELKISVFNFM